MDRKKWKKIKKKVYSDPDYRPPQYDALSDLVAGRTQAGPHSTPPRADTDLDHWQWRSDRSYSTRLNYERRPEVFLRPPIFLLSAA